MRTIANSIKVQKKVFLFFKFFIFINVPDPLSENNSNKTERGLRPSYVHSSHIIFYIQTSIYFWYHALSNRFIFIISNIFEELISEISFFSLSKTPSTFVIKSSLLDLRDFATAPATISINIIGLFIFPNPRGEIIGIILFLNFSKLFLY